MVIIMNKDLKEILIHDKVESLKDNCNVYLDLSEKLGSGNVLLRLIGQIISQSKMLEGLINEEEN